MRARRSAPPCWFVVCVAVALAVLLRAVDPCPSAPAPAGGHLPDVQLAFFGFFLAVAGWIWNAFQAAGALTLEALAWAVKVLQSGAVRLGNAIKDGADILRRGFLASWGFLKLTYDDVLKPAWLKFWRWFDRLRTWLNDTVGPVLQWLRDLRTTLLDFWKTYVRPWLDLIDVTRKLLRVLSSLGLTWARALDQELGRIEGLIERPFRFVLGKLNEVINIVNTVITAGGLLQRVALIHSLARDYKFVWANITAPYSDAASDGDKAIAQTKPDPFSFPAVTSSTAEYLRYGTGPLTATIDEQAVMWRRYISG